MNRCKKCNVNVYESESHCPLCHSKMENVSATIVEYPKYKDIIKEKSPLKNIPLFIATASVLICVYINIFTHQKGEVLWSVIVSASLLYSLAMYHLVQNDTKKFGSKLLYSYILLSLLVIIIDFTSGMLLWSISYVVPFLALAFNLYLTALALRSKKVFSEYFGYILVIIALDIGTTFLDLIIFKNYSWSEFITVITGIIIALVLYLFADKSLKQEIKKRFHR